MDKLEIYIALLGITVIVSMVFRKSTIPIPLLLVIAGILLSLFPGIPPVELDPKLILDVFLPMLVYTASAEFSWRDVKVNMRPILLLSVGHVLFITALIALLMHQMVPELGWARAILLGAVISPPDDVAILAIANKVSMPQRVVTILKGESLLNDATALILFRFALAAILTKQFSPTAAISAFFIVILCETLYGLVLGFLIGELRLRIKDPSLQMIVSILTPFFAYLPAEKMGGCGVLATVVTGFVIGTRYLYRLSPEARLTAISVWATIAFALQSILFLLVGLDFNSTLAGIASIPLKDLFTYSSLVVLVVILGRFIWVFPAAYLPRFLFLSIRKKDPSPPWQLPFLISWSGMRGGISLAAALAVPILPTMINGIDPRDFLIFLVFIVIMATLLVQGLSLPWLIKALGLKAYGQREKYSEHISELIARERLTKAVIIWLEGYRKEIKDNPTLAAMIDLKIRDYQIRKNQFDESIRKHEGTFVHDEKAEQRELSYLAAQIEEVQRAELLHLWKKNKISHATRNKLLQQLDHRYKHIYG